MSVLLEFTVASKEFQLGQVLAHPSGMHIEIERVVPTGDQIMPFIWVTGDDHAEFEESVRDHAAVRELVALDPISNSCLYRLEWEHAGDDIVDGIALAEGTVLEATRDEQWLFRLRFPDHTGLTEFHNYCTEHEISIHVERTYTLSEATDEHRQFDLTDEQRAALVLALRRGYFATPRETSLGDIADELDISRQALSNRIRRSNEKVLQTVLISSFPDIE
ncbi:helix-turn-helix domain-containing protein [Haloarcula salina]|uniref:Helix-turn-helix domain-containing protein n=1 Tax=Haloarcula salina TaxID=1429914 RepID=A0AA41KEF9_9EURY|nr:helix-turn-helix domain-containing protein [Haloarcula salina]MBV0900837.1 helix-turn-helix domain-containing protein [Haloarcula salina]